jgi:hypothetical protein
MASWMWDMMLFSWGFLAGLGAALAGVAVARMRSEARRGGEDLVAQLGTIDTRRFLEAATK